jgi:hypothetical protein
LLKWCGNKSNWRFWINRFLGKRTIRRILFEKGKMSRRREIWVFSLLAVAALLVQNASATYYLPDNSYVGGPWRGGSIRKESGFDALLDFAVYDTDSLKFVYETALADQLNVDGQYIYTYRIFNRADEIYEVIAYFGTLDIGGEQISEALLRGDNCCHGNCSWAVTPTSKDSGTQRVRTWTSDGGRTFRGGHSRFLVCR